MVSRDPNYVIASEDTDVNEWLRFGMRLGVSAALHPFEYSKVLIQLGYEPIPPRPSRSLLGKRIMLLPNIFQYTSHIRRVDGFIGCYRGLTPKLVGSVLSMICSEKLVQRLGFEQIDEKDNDDSVLSNEELYRNFKYNLKRDMILCVSGIVVSHPFQVISIRMMAQFVGRETYYNSLYGSICEIYKTNGILGFFAGIVPKLLCDVACLVLTSSTMFVVNKYIVKDKIGRQYSNGLAQFIYSGLLYPFQVISTCMTVTGSYLQAGHPPNMPLYKNWVACWDDLDARNALKRGSSIFWRTAPIYKTSAQPGLKSIELIK